RWRPIGALLLQAQSAAEEQGGVARRNRIGVVQPHRMALVESVPGPPRRTACWPHCQREDERSECRQPVLQAGSRLACVHGSCCYCPRPPRVQSGRPLLISTEIPLVGLQPPLPSPLRLNPPANRQEPLAPTLHVAPSWSISCCMASAFDRL